MLAMGLQAAWRCWPTSTAWAAATTSCCPALDWAACPVRSWAAAHAGLLALAGRTRSRHLALFSFLYFEKIKISKIYVRSEKFQKHPPVAPHRATGPKCNFFSSNSQRGPWLKKRACRPPRATAPSPYISPGRHMPPSPLSFEPRNSGKKRGVRRRKAAKLCRIAYL